MANQSTATRMSSEETINMSQHDTEAARPSEEPERALEKHSKQFQDDIVTFDSKDDPTNPMNWSEGKKWRCVALYGFTTMTATFASSIFASATPFVADQFGITDEVGILGVSLFLFGFTVGPIAWGPISEVYGRKVAIVPAMFVFACFSAATATATNIQTVMIARFFGGVFGSAPVTCVGGGINDLFNQRERASALVVYSLCIVGGPTLAPVIGSAVSESYLTWRWTEYLCVILTGFMVIMDMLFLPETSAPIILTRKAVKMRRETGRWALHSQHETQDRSLSGFLHKSLNMPLKMLATEPMLLLIVLYNAFAYGILYLLFASLDIIYGQRRGWSPVPSALPNLATLVGTLVAAMINFTYNRIFYARYLDTHSEKAPPERRLPPMMIGAVAFPVGFFILGWTSNPDVFWFPSVIGLFFIGMSFLLIFQSGMNYLLDSFQKYAASAVAANTFLRSLIGGALPLVARPMFDRLGVNYGCTLLGAIGVLLGFSPFVFFKFGARIRRSSKMCPSGE